MIATKYVSVGFILHLTSILSSIQGMGLYEESVKRSNSDSLDTEAIANGNTILLQGPPNIVLFDMDTQKVINSSLPNVQRTEDITALAWDGIRVYWISNKTINSANFYGNDVKTISQYHADSEVVAISVDPSTNCLFYTDQGLKRVQMSSSGILPCQYGSQTIDTNIDKPRAIAFNKLNRAMYWSDEGSKPKIESAHYDGSHRQVILSTDLVAPTTLAVDSKANKIYWVDSSMGRLESLDLNDKTRILLSKVDHGIYHSIVLHYSRVYLVDQNQKGGEIKFYSFSTTGGDSKLYSVTANKGGNYSIIIIHKSGEEHGKVAVYVGIAIGSVNFIALLAIAVCYLKKYFDRSKHSIRNADSHGYMGLLFPAGQTDADTSNNGNSSPLIQANRDCDEDYAQIEDTYTPESFQLQMFCSERKPMPLPRNAIDDGPQNAKSGAELCSSDGDSTLYSNPYLSLDNDNNLYHTASTSSSGFRGKNSACPTKIKVSYILETAHERDSTTNPCKQGSDGLAPVNQSQTSTLAQEARKRSQISTLEARKRSKISILEARKQSQEILIENSIIVTRSNDKGVRETAL